MLKRLPSKNQRSKGVRVKHVLQICVLVGICFWLVYQIKHSHEKKKEFDEGSSKISNENNAENLRLGRKDLPREDPTRNENDEEREEVEEEEDEETKNDHPETENEIEENDDDDVDNRMEKTDEDSVEENGGGDSNDQVETVDSFDHEAREEHYRGDDASSEVTHEGEEEEEGQLLEEEASDGTTDDNTPDGTETDDESSEKYVEDEDDRITMVSQSKKVRHSALSTKQSNEEEGTENNDNNNNNVVQTGTESSNSSFVEKSIEISYSSQPNSTEGSVSDLGLAQNVTNSVDSENIRVEPNSTVLSETGYKDEVSKDNAVSNGTVQTEEREGSSEKLEETVDPTQPAPIDSTDTQIGQEMNKARTDLETLPDFTKPQGNNNDNEEIAAE